MTENLFDIEVLDDENNQITQFEGSVEGETIENLEPGTYTVNERVANDITFNHLFEEDRLTSTCIDFRFEGGGFLFRINGIDIDNEICFEYEDELGNDCSTIALAAGESKTCIVKNYIKTAKENLPDEDL